MTELGTIRGRTVYGQLNHRGYGKVGLVTADPYETPVLLIMSTMAGVMGPIV